MYPRSRSSSIASSGDSRDSTRAGPKRSVPTDCNVTQPCRPTRVLRFSHGQEPNSIDLLELDIDLRLADLWREAADVQDWNLDVVAAFMRAAYGKGYCDALTEEAPGSLCEEHGRPDPWSAPADARLTSARRNLRLESARGPGRSREA